MKNIITIIIMMAFLGGCTTSTVEFVSGAVKAEIECYKKYPDKKTKRRLCLAKKYVKYKIEKEYLAKKSAK